MEIKAGKTFERPAAGPFLGRVIDVVDMPQVKSTFNGVTSLIDKVRIIWVLGRLDGTPYLDKEGNPFTVAEFYPAKNSPKSKLYKAIFEILGQAPPLYTNSDQLAELLLNRVSTLFLVKADNAQDPNDPFTNVQGHSPVSPTQVPPAVPNGFVRDKFIPRDAQGNKIQQVKTQAGPQGQPVQTFATQPTPEQIAAYLAAQASNTVNLEPAKSGKQPF